MSPPAAIMLHHRAEESWCSGDGESCIQEEASMSTKLPRKMIVFDKKESEKQISVDPISLRESAADHMHPMMYPGPNAKVVLPPASTSKFMSYSLPNSASSSPRFDQLAFKKHKKKYKNIHGGPVVSPLARQHSVALGNLERLRENHLRRSKSCGEGRACQPSLDFDLWSSQRDMETHEVRSVEKREEGIRKKLGAGREERWEASYEEKFKCGACLFLPGLGKGKTVMRGRKEVEVEHVEINNNINVSQRVSLEKFECGSWRSSAIINIEEDIGEGTISNLFFDLPVELMRYSSVNDTESPVTTGFVFDNKQQQQLEHHRKGVLKSTSKKTSQESPANFNSSRHVRFSTSTCPVSPTSPSSSSSCATPTLHKARDDFNAFLEAQS